LVWNGLDQVFQGFRANHFPAGIYRGLKIFKISGVRFCFFHPGFENSTQKSYGRQVRRLWESVVFDLELRKIVSEPI
jgi:hypothetical protein